MRDKWLSRGVRVLWLAVIIGIAWATWAITYDLAGIGIVSGFAAVTWTVLALLAGRPYLAGTKEHWGLAVSLVPKSKRHRGLSLRSLWLVEVGFRVKPLRRFSFFRTVALIGAFTVIAADLTLPYLKARITRALPNDPSVLLNYDPQVTTRVWSSDGKLVCAFGLENRVVVRIDGIPPLVRQAFIAAEDQRFYAHHGIDFWGIARASLAYAHSGRATQGASTLTQQVIKNVLLGDSSRTVARKLREIILAVEMERKMSKRQILDVYLNHVYLGRNAFGVEAAAQTYFSKHVSQLSDGTPLSIAEAAMLAGLPKAPSRFSPYSHFDRAVVRQRYVLGRMRELGFITERQYAAALAEDVGIVSRPHLLNADAAPYFCELTRRELTRLYGAHAVWSGGLTVVTTVTMTRQLVAQAAVVNGLRDLERRIGWNGPEGRDASYTGCIGAKEPVSDDAIELARLAHADKDGYAVCVRGQLFPVYPEDAGRMRDWERRSKTTLVPSDILSVQIQQLDMPGTKGAHLGPKARYAIMARRTGGKDALQAVLVSIDPRTGWLEALVGGNDYAEMQFDIATQSRRMPGSSFKPVTYAAALETGITVDERVRDEPVCIGSYCIHNYADSHIARQYRGVVSLDEALAQSLNSVAMKLALRVGLDKVISVARRLGIASPLPRQWPLAIGGIEITPWENAYAFAQVAAQGHAAPRMPDGPDGKGPGRVGVFIRDVRDRSGKTLFHIEPTVPADRPLALQSEAVDASLQFLLREVIATGTGKGARDLGWPLIGKTGTSNEFRDVWFHGCAPVLCATVWVGRLTPTPIVREGSGERADGATGGRVALPFWKAYMKPALEGITPIGFPMSADARLLLRKDGKLAPYMPGTMPLGGAPDGPTTQVASP